MNADSPSGGRPRVVHDPDLPPRVRRRLERLRTELLPRNRQPRNPDWRRRAGYAAAAGLLALSWGCAHLAPLVPSLADLAVRTISTLGLGALVLWGFRQKGRLGGVLALLLAWGPLFLVWAAEEQVALTGGAALFWAVGPVASLALAVRVTPSAASRHHGRYLVPEDFESKDAAVLARLQRATDGVREAASVLGENIGPGQDERWLREQEWSIATDLHQCSKLAADLESRSRAAVTPRVTASLEPQRTALEHARAAVGRRVRRFEEYAESASMAATTHEELRQCEENERHNDAFLGLLTSTVSGAAGDLLGDSGIRALQEALEEQVTLTVAAGRWLVETVDQGQEAGQEGPDGAE